MPPAARIEGDVVTIEALEKANIIGRSIKRAKIMLSGEVAKAYTIDGIGVTKGARAAILAAGGKIVEAAAESSAA